MDTVSISHNSPKTLLLAADGMFSSFHLDTDIVWTVEFNTADTHSFHLHTTYGLLARSMRVFPNFFADGTRFSQPEDFKSPPRVSRIAPAYLCLDYQLPNGIEVRFEIFVPEPSILVGEIALLNPNNEPVSFAVELAAILMPMGKGHVVRPKQKEHHRILTGASDCLHMVLFMAGGPSAIANPYPMLTIPTTIDPQGERSWSWALASKESLESAYAAAVKAAESPWKANAEAQWMRHASTTIHIHTGHADFDSALLFSQMAAMTHLVQDPAQSHPHFVRSRLPDIKPQSGQSQSDQQDLTLLDAVHLAEVLLPAHHELMASVVETFLNRIDQNGRLTSRLVKSNFITPYQECPLLAGLCLEIFEINQEKTFLARAYPHLKRYIAALLDDLDKRGEIIGLAWENPDQLQMDTGLFTFDRWSPSGSGLDISLVESPAYIAMLLRELKALQTIANQLGESDDNKKWTGFEKSLKNKLNRFWDAKYQRFVYLDRDSHLAPNRELYFPAPAQKSQQIRKHFTKPQRLQCHLFSSDDATRVCCVTLFGKDLDGKPVTESFKPSDIRWIGGRVHLTTRHLYTILESAAFKGLKPKDQILIETADLSQDDISCMLPIWAGSATQQQLQAMIDNRLDGKIPANQFGVPETWQFLKDLPEELPVRVNVLWNTLIIKGLDDAGFHEQAMQIFSNLMNIITIGLKKFNGFYPYFDHITGHPSGTQNALQGLLPVRLLLQIAGMRLFSPSRVAIWGCNPFPWPIEVTWQGLSLRRDGKNCWITFPDGTSFHHDTKKPILYSSHSH